MSLKSICLSSALIAASFIANAQTDDSLMQSSKALNGMSVSEADGAASAKSGSAEAVFEVESAKTDSASIYPCPFGWSVIPNPSVDNSLTYENANSALSISVTSLKSGITQNARADAFARVASEQMNCNLPGKSNLIEDGYTFECPADGVEAIVYGESGELVLLVISGRNKDTEADLENFVKFLAFEAKNR